MKFSLLFLVLILISCRNKQLSCKSFDFNKIPFNESYYYQSLKYTNYSDTITLLLKNKNHSKESVWGSMGHSCNPYFEIDFSDIEKRLHILYSFSYFDMDTKDTSMYLSIHVNSSRIELNMDTLFGRLDDVLTFSKLELMNKNDIIESVRRIKFQNMKIIEIETFTGEKWKLLNALSTTISDTSVK